MLYIPYMYVGDKNEEEPSDLNHGLSLKQARENFKEFGVVLERLGSVLSKG